LNHELHHGSVLQRSLVRRFDFQLADLLTLLFTGFAFAVLFVGPRDRVARGSVTTTRCSHPTTATWIGAAVVFVVGVLIPVAVRARSIGRTGFSRAGASWGTAVVDDRTLTPIGFRRAFLRSLFAGLVSIPYRSRIAAWAA
jgi:hypothetical protein